MSRLRLLLLTLSVLLSAQALFLMVRLQVIESGRLLLSQLGEYSLMHLCVQLSSRLLLEQLLLESIERHLLCLCGPTDFFDPLLPALLQLRQLLRVSRRSLLGLGSQVSDLLLLLL